MAIRVECRCGKRFRAADEFEGRRAICPACKREFIFQRAERPKSVVVRQDEIRPEAPPDMPAELTEKSEPTGKRGRPWWRDPIVVFGWFLPVFGLLGFLGWVAWSHIQRRPARAAVGVAAEADTRPRTPVVADAREGPGLHAARDKGIPRIKRVTQAIQTIVTNSIGMKLVPIPSGEFEMGNREGSRGMHWEAPRHHIKITRPFYVTAYEVTRGQFRRFVDDAGYSTEAERDGRGGFGWVENTGMWKQAPDYSWRNAGFDQTDDHPVVNVTWNDTVAFAEWLSRKETRTYRLPTEAEWEYVCRAGTSSDYSFGDNPEGLAATGNVIDATLRAKFPRWPLGDPIKEADGFVFTAPVGSFRPNAFGVFDMHGNVAELCFDGFLEDYYKNSPLVDPTGAPSSPARAFRGGSWRYDYEFARSANRNGQLPTVRSTDIGFRLVRVSTGTPKVAQSGNGPSGDPGIARTRETVAAEPGGARPSRSEVEHWQALRTFEEEAHIKVTLAEQTVKPIKVSDVEVKAILDEERKIPWLWEATATVSFEDEPGQSWLWRRVFWHAPKIGKAPCWLEIKALRDGRTNRKHFQLSEWTEQFRAMVASDWQMVLKSHERDTQGQAREVKERDLRMRKETLAKKFEITIEEFQEIIAATR
jgi:formylglycine-generating enzyme required for sulfatase activity